jgi:alpha-L-arabinofuranosidase
MTEWNWNGWWILNWADDPTIKPFGPDPFNSLFAKGIGAAGILHAIMRNGDVTAIATQSMLVGDNWDIHAIFADRKGQMEPYMLPTGQVTMLYSKYHGIDRLGVETVNMAYYEQPYRMGSISPQSRVAYLDVLATRDENTLYLHNINRHFNRTLSVQFDISELEENPAKNGIIHILEGRLTNEAAAGEPRAPGWIKEQTFHIPGSRFEVQLPARTVSVVEVPLE